MAFQRIHPGGQMLGACVVVTAGLVAGTVDGE